MREGCTGHRSCRCVLCCWVYSGKCVLFSGLIKQLSLRSLLSNIQLALRVSLWPVPQLWLFALLLDSQLPLCLCCIAVQAPGPDCLPLDTTLAVVMVR